MKVLITGDTGFIGGHMKQFLTQQKSGSVLSKQTAMLRVFFVDRPQYLVGVLLSVHIRQDVFVFAERSNVPVSMSAPLQ